MFNKHGYLGNDELELTHPEAQLQQEVIGVYDLCYKISVQNVDRKILQLIDATLLMHGHVPSSGIITLQLIHKLL